MVSKEEPDMGNSRLGPLAARTTVQVPCDGGLGSAAQRGSYSGGEPVEVGEREVGFDDGKRFRDHRVVSNVSSGTVMTDRTALSLGSTMA